MANLSGADLNALAQMKQDLERQASALQAVANAATAGVNTLNQLWEGPDSRAFTQQWATDHRAKLLQAVSELNSAAETIERNRQAQEQTSAADGGGPVLTNGPRGPGFPGGGSNPIQPTPPDEVFNTDYMDDFIGLEVPVSDPARLNVLMEQLMGDDLTETETKAVLTEIAELRGYEDPADFVAQYDQYLDLADRAGAPLDVDRHPDFLGGTTSLRFGTVVGDVLGVDPVFGALLSPAGGLIGPGMDAYEPGDNDAIGYHGVFHDAAGYLYNSHDNLGPGYDYLDRSPLPTSWNYTGQITGVSWWVGTHPGLDVDASQLGLLAPESLGPVPLSLSESLSDGGFEEVAGQVFVVREGLNQLDDGISRLVEGDASGFGVIGEGTKDLVAGTADNLWDFGIKSLPGDPPSFVPDAPWEVPGALWDSTTDAAADAWDTTTDVATDAWDTTTDVATDAWDSSTDAASDAWDSTADAASDAWDSTTDAASDTWRGLTEILG